MHVHIADGSERISLDGGEGDKVGALGAHARYEAEELFGVAGLAEQNDDVARGENANVAVEGIDRGEERRANAEGDEGLRDLVGDEAGFADAGEEDGSGGGEEGVSEGQGLWEGEVLEEEVEVALLGFEEVEEVSFVNSGVIFRWVWERTHFFECFGEKRKRSDVRCI